MSAQDDPAQYISQGHPNYRRPPGMNPLNLNEVQFADHDLDNERAIIAKHKGKIIGHMVWSKENEPHTEPGEITDVYTHKGYRQQGLARAMYSRAQQFTPQPVHSHSRSGLGAIWAEKMGGPALEHTHDVDYDNGTSAPRSR